MNIIEFSEGLQAKMKQELDNLNVDQDDIIKIGKLLTFIRELITELKAFTRNYKFQSQAEEIQFFKEVKPVFLRQYFYYKKVVAGKLFDSFKDTKTRQANYYRMLRRLEKHLIKNFQFYQYCMSGETYLDAHYFTLGTQYPKALDKDEHFSTGYDMKLGKILANDLLKNHIVTSLMKLRHGATEQTMLTWTGSKASLIELVYALHSAEIFNDGKADIKSIATSFENFFNVRLGNYYRAFQEIRLRKSGQTNFLDLLREKLAIKNERI